MCDFRIDNRAGKCKCNILDNCGIRLLRKVRQWANTRRYLEKKRNYTSIDDITSCTWKRKQKTCAGIVTVLVTGRTKTSVRSQSVKARPNGTATLRD